MEKNIKLLLKKQHYGLVGKSTSVKVCTWTRKSIWNQGVCYKEKFYGIRSHMCCQMTPDTNFCQNKCIFCWRNLEGTEGSMNTEDIDEPTFIIDESIKKQKHLLNGYPGNSKTNMKKWKEAQEPMHFAISLAGEPTLYPKLSGLIKELHDKHKTTFLVTNGLMPERLLELESKDALPTQLYVSLDAPNKELFFQIDRCSLKDGWDRLMKTFDILKTLKNNTRTSVRITLIRNMNMVEPENYAALIIRSDALFVEVKAYMHVGSSRERLSIKHMPLHPEVKAFALEIAKHCGYKIIDEQESSRVVLLMKKDIPDRIMKF